jgi:histidinol phosphatase-like enzyme
MIYIVDIDGTICRTESDQYGKTDYENSVPIVERIEKINRLYDEGHTIHYWTARGSASGIDRSELTKAQLQQWGVKYHKLMLGKPVYDLWIDDKAINSETFFDD